MSGQGFFFKAINLASNCRFLLNNRAIQVTQVSGLRHKVSDKLKELNVPEKPKRPLTPYFRFVQDQRDKIVKQHPDWKVTDVIKLCAAEWKTVDLLVKGKYEEAYKTDLEKYAKQFNEYSEKLTVDQKEALKEYRKEVKKAKVRREHKKKNKENNKPKKPPTAYILFLMDHAKRDGTKYSELIKELKDKWAQLPLEEKVVYEEKFLKSSEQYKKELKEWEIKMIKEGKPELVRHSTLTSHPPSPIMKPKKQ